MLNRLRARARASASVEFALIAVFILLPLIAGVSDFVVVISAQAQLNTALQALYYFAYANPTTAVAYTSASTIAYQSYIISQINSSSDYQIALKPNGSYNSTLTYYCVTTSSGTISSVYTAPPTCAANQTEQIYVNYTVTASVNVPFPGPLKLSNPFALSATGGVQVQ
jgi:Flp pilus assembly protein TadG